MSCTTILPLLLLGLKPGTFLKHVLHYHFLLLLLGLKPGTFLKHVLHYHFAVAPTRTQTRDLSKTSPVLHHFPQGPEPETFLKHVLLSTIFLLLLVLPGLESGTFVKQVLRSTTEPFPLPAGLRGSPAAPAHCGSWPRSVAAAELRAAGAQCE